MPTQDELEGSFRTHEHYINALAFLCRVPYGSKALGANIERDLPNLVGPTLASPSITPPPSSKPALSATKTSLANAWGTELLLAFGSEVAFEDELLRLMNNWGVVQAYYAGYHAVQALALARGNPRPDSHPKTQKQYVSLWVDRPLQLPPWTLGAKDGGWCNLPDRRTIDDSIHPWQGVTPGNCWDIAYKALRTTRRDAIPEALQRARQSKRKAKAKAWREEEKARLQAGKRARKEPTIALPHLTQHERTKVNARVRSYSLLDYLFRLRVKANYEESAMFTDGPTDDTASWMVNRNLCYLTACTLLVHELHIRELVGRDVLLGWADDWLARTAGPRTTEIGLGQRRALL